jgi:O-antigen/teichoic acid export membrane protein
MTAATLPVAEPVKSSVLKPALLLMVGRTIAFAATFFIPVVIARVFDPAHFGTYKQLFLVQSTVYLIGQIGMATSLYYFLPLAPRDAGRYVANSLVFLAGAGMVGCAAIIFGAPQLGRWLSNAELARYVPWIGLYLLFTIPAASFEIVLVSRGKYIWASAAYALSDFARACASILPVLLFHDLELLLKANVAAAAIRLAIALLYFRSQFGSSLRPDGKLMRQQLVYCLPFGLAVLVEILQWNLPQYAVSHLTDPGTFAIFAVGCLSIPLVEFATSPASDVMMVKMQESLAEGRLGPVLEIWRDTTWKLALLFFPLVGMVVVLARELILLLFTAKYAASIPLFMVWSSLILLATLQVDGVLRVFAQTRLILVLNLMRLAIIGGLIQWSLSALHLLGPVLVIVLATLAFKVAALARMRTLLQVPLRELLPWKSLAGLASASIGAGAVAFVVKSQLTAGLLVVLAAASVAYILTYVLWVWTFRLLQESEQLAIAAWAGRVSGNIAQVLALSKGRVT